MRRYLLWIVVVAAVQGPRAAQAQYGYPGGYGGWGWNGWGSTVQGNIANGLGYFRVGQGVYNLDTAKAESINTATAIRWNQAVWQSQQALNRSNYLRRMRRKQNIDRAQAEIYDRLRNHPETYDIQTGDALNVVLDILVNPANSGSAFRAIKSPVGRDVVQNIPFEYASEAVTICLDQIVLKDGWPLALNGDDLAADRRAVQDAIKNALEEDERGELRPKSIQAISEAVDTLRRHFEKSVPGDSPDYVPARDFLKTIAAFARMLHSPQVDQILAELEKVPATTVGELAGVHASVQPSVRAGEVVPPAADLCKPLPDAGRRRGQQRVQCAGSQRRRKAG